MVNALSVFAAAREHGQRAALVVDGAVIRWDELAERARAFVDRHRGASAPVVIAPGRALDDVAEIHGLIELGVPFLPVAATVAGADDERSDTDPTRFGRTALAWVRTSGSEGAPKTVSLSREAFLASAEASAANLGWHDDDRWLLAMPLSHVGGLSILVRCLVARACVVLRREAPFEAAEVAAQIERDRVTLVSMVPTMLVRMLDAGWRAPVHLRAVLLGGASAAPDLLARADDRDIPVLTTYGLTEACSQVTTQPYGTRNRGALGAGRPVRGAEVRIVDGEIEVRGPMLMDGYLDAPSAFTGDGFLRTGDLGALDEDGNLHVVGRRDDRIVTGGENVDPLAVERVLARCPGVRAACVVGIADREWGERVAALVVADGATERDIVGWAHGHLAPPARPRVVRLAADLPLTPSGKLDRSAARRALASRCK